MEAKPLEELEKSVKALLLLGLQAQLPAEEREKPEVLMSRAGFIAREIADLLGKKESAVSKSIQRAGKKRKS